MAASSLPVWPWSPGLRFALTGVSSALGAFPGALAAARAPSAAPLAPSTQNTAEEGGSTDGNFSSCKATDLTPRPFLPLKFFFSLLLWLQCWQIYDSEPVRLSRSTVSSKFLS